MVVCELAFRTEEGFERAAEEDYLYAHRRCFFTTE